MKDAIRALCLKTIEAGDKIDPGTNKPTHFRWSVSEELNYWRARAMVAEEKLEQQAAEKA